MDRTGGRPSGTRKPGTLVLVVDDDGATLRWLRALLERAGYLVDTATGGAEALDRVQVFQPDLVLLDIHMPEMDGIEACRRIREQTWGASLPILFMTGDDRTETYVRAIQARGDDFLRKPLLPGELLVRIRSLLKLRSAQAGIREERHALAELHRHHRTMFGFIVHDLKAPLTTLGLGLELLLGQHAEALPAKTLGRLKESVRTMDRLVHDILDLSRADQMGLEPRFALLTMPAWLDQVLGKVEDQAQWKHHRIDWTCPPALEARADPRLLERLLINLLENAVKHTEPGSQIRVQAWATDTGTRLEVRDEGPGVPVHLRPHIFERFLHASPAGLEQGTSTGLGLAFCRLVAEAHQGRIWVEDNAPRGSAFILEWPGRESAG